MNQVSSQAFQLPRLMAQLANLDFGELTRGLGLEGRLDDPDGSCSWDAFATLYERFAERVRDEAALMDLARRATEASRPTSGLGRALRGEPLAPQQVYELLMKYTGPRLFQPVRFEREALPDGALQLEVVIDDSVRGCRPWLAVFEAAMGPLPTLLDLPPSRVVRVSLEPRRAVLRIEPAEVTLPTGPRADEARALIEELVAQQARLTKVYDELRRSERDFKAMLEELPALVALHDHGRLVYVNEAFARFFRLTPESLAGRTLQSLFSRAERLHLESTIGETVEGWHAVEVEVGGEKRVLRTRAGGRLLYRGAPAALWVAGDVTREEAARERAERSESTLAAVLDALPDLVLRFDAQRRLVAVHGGALLGERAALTRYVGATLLELHRAWGREDWEANRRIRELLDDALERGLSSQLSYTSPDPVTGEQRDFRLEVEALDGEALMVVRDRSRERVDEKRMQIAERMASLGDLAAGVSHEINNPLTSVVSNLSVLKRRLAQRPTTPRTQALMADLEEGCRQIRQTAGRLREFSATRSRTHGAVRVHELVERAQRLTRTELQPKARLDVHLEPGLEVWGDSAELEDVLLNLLSNAAQAMPDRASPDTHHVWVKARREDGFARLEVSDDGTGISPANLAHVFEPFFTTRPRRGGAGLGLAVCHRVVTAHGGTIDAHSEPGRTTFTVRLPLARAPETKRAQKTPQRRGKVMVVDDEPAIGRSIQRALPQHDVVVVGDGREAFHRLREGDLPDLVLCDLLMPGYTGMELYAALRHARPELLERVAFMSGGTFTPLAAEFLTDHPVSVLPKPFNAERLDALVERVLTTGSTEGFRGE